MSRRLALLAVAMLLSVTGCAGAGALRRPNPGNKLKFVSLPENEARAKITASCTE
jgi:sorbitol/mannitol transport system substrate-binding protein